MSVSTSSSPTPSKNAMASQKRPIAEIITEKFPPFDHRSAIVEPFDNETKRDAEFMEKLNTMLLELMLEFHAWSTARSAHESDKTADALEKEVKAVMELEQEQGMSSSSPSLSLVERTRQQLSDFVTRIKLALAALTGLAG
ncbi:hypothetical protein IEO21_03990 [Rhodonia placenta]|uniref:Uncharacterized protein n=1 Tax=Rhodonia placenta TaxID=104341 RepID=A0A8H7U2Y8_9APHY|nr:hypothetical protein IEO21_03990 [Postia placenta]